MNTLYQAIGPKSPKTCQHAIRIAISLSPPSPYYKSKNNCRLPLFTGLHPQSHYIIASAAEFTTNYYRTTVLAIGATGKFTLILAV